MRPANRNPLPGSRVRVIRYRVAADVDYGSDGGVIAGSLGSIGVRLWEHHFKHTVTLGKLHQG